MKHELFNITGEKRAATQGLDVQLSFNPFISFLKERAEDAGKMKKEFFEFVLAKFSANQYFNDQMPVGDTAFVVEELELMYNLLQPPLTDESTSLWGLSMPLEPVLFYGTTGIYEFLSTERPMVSETACTPTEEQLHDYMRFIYFLIYSKVFDSGSSPLYHLKHSLIISNTGLLKYYKVKVDARFIDVQVKKPLPPVYAAHFANELKKETFDWKAAIQQLPLDHFSFRGVGIVTIEDVSAEQTVENIKNLALNRSAHFDPDYNRSLQQALKSLLGSSDINIGVLPNLRINNRLVFSAREGAAFAPWIAQHNEGLEDTISAFFDERLNKDKPVMLMEDEVPEKFGAFWEKLREDNISTYILLPVFHSDKLAGALELYSTKKEEFSLERLEKLRPVLPVIAQLLKDRIDEFNSSIDNIIREKFTAMQPAVQWKFNEIAWNYLNDYDTKEEKPAVQKIAFENVHPLYGAVDIRNSTEERNHALAADLECQLHELISTLEKAKEVTGMVLIDELIFKCTQWQNRIREHYNDADAHALTEFLEQQADPLLQHLVISHSVLKPDIEHYFESINETSGIAFKNRRALERSINAINTVVSKHLEGFNNELQKIFPVYFEKFRTDGLEYDIYMGQSIAADRPYDPAYLKNVRLLQLKSMVEIARLTNGLCTQHEYELKTTQLIYVRSQPIDIVFRPDERKFDVDGSYNIRYQVVKKRIDKVHLKNSSERLTQPGKISLVYFNKNEADEYTGYIQYLQSQGMLADDLEYLDLEELQGVYGLRALRVGVLY